MDKNILIVGVGGQGTLLASVLLGNLALDSGYDVKLSEVHGMSQRGGDVVTHVKISDSKVNSPLIEKGEADMIIGFEKLEAYRWLPYLKKGGECFVNDQQIMPMPVILGQTAYPEDADSIIKSRAGRVVAFDALKIAEECGSSKAVNVVLLGAASGSLPFGEEQWIKVIEENVKPKFVDLNKEAFIKGARQ
ncbi:MAG: indolepyruvate oxidoreductase subunit beta [Clostridiales bacterium]|nr:indolepyruvate oxidoreductase subunit beta [Clostridiales bacterium]MDD7035961.1 indolepyruvate oxidoreductase subunit beta [Bacillota bacterium]MDY2920483.1 indolepyruvate oxidoreductase subunit beta [Lentihominibacter sp.]